MLGLKSNPSLHVVFNGVNTGLIIEAYAVNNGGVLSSTENPDLIVNHDFLDDDSFDAYEKLIADPAHYVRNLARSYCEDENGDVCETLQMAIRVSVTGNELDNFDELILIDDKKGINKRLNMNVKDVDLMSSKNEAGNVIMNSIKSIMSVVTEGSSEVADYFEAVISDLEKD